MAVYVGASTSGQKVKKDGQIPKKEKKEQLTTVHAQDGPERTREKGARRHPCTRETETGASEGPEERLHADDLPSPRPAAPHGAPPSARLLRGKRAQVHGQPPTASRVSLRRNAGESDGGGEGLAAPAHRPRRTGLPPAQAASRPAGSSAPRQSRDGDAVGPQRVTGQPDSGPPKRALLALEPGLLTPAPRQAGESRLRPAHCGVQLLAPPGKDQKAWPEHLHAAYLSDTQAERAAGRADRPRSKAQGTIWPGNLACRSA
ncbi:basic salivary proline-rich protein 3-like [Balaenoptera acutorostrata]|uniref:Basic salivary proline-rich protein 3-like n=1 Tax=Balaenoptera acutorostrata TaxID=9767 RepID=A0A452CPN3_BALAC|nr:basic salivary proline-rich protein 3-like [Balaenoptera acutorostrata]